MGNTCLRKYEVVPKPLPAIDNNRTTFLSDQNPSYQVTVPNWDQVCAQTVSYSYQPNNSELQLVAANAPSPTSNLDEVWQGFNVEWRNTSSRTSSIKNRTRISVPPPILIEQATKARARELCASEDPSHRNSINTPVPINSDGSLKIHSYSLHQNQNEQKLNEHLHHSAHVSPHNVIYQNELETSIYYGSYVQNY